MFRDQWSFGVWQPGFFREFTPNIVYVELFALCVSIFIWADKLRNTKFIIFCDNKSARDMVNSQFSRCKHCMKLLRLLTINNLKHNRRLKVVYVKSQDNTRADALIRGDFQTFFNNSTENVDRSPRPLPPEL